jgi:hypothetical protein
MRTPTNVHSATRIGNLSKSEPSMEIRYTTTGAALRADPTRPRLIFHKLGYSITNFARRSRHSKVAATIVIGETCGKLFGTRVFF